MGDNLYHFRFSMFFLLSIFASGCASSYVDQSERAERELTVSENLLGPANVNGEELSKYAARHGNDPVALGRLDLYRRISFYVGAVGGVYSFVADKQGNVIGRTIGNGLWGIGWTCWLGFGAVVRADLQKDTGETHDAFFDKTDSVVSGNPSVPSWALVWRYAEF